MDSGAVLTYTLTGFFLEPQWTDLDVVLGAELNQITVNEQSRVIFDLH